MKLIILNLPRDFSEDDLVRLFEIHGEIKTSNLVIDENTGVSKGFGFVEMALETEAEIAISELHGTRIKRHKIRVKPAD